MANSKREKLDFESPEDRQARLGQLLSSISSPKYISSPKTAGNESSSPILPAGRPETFHVGESDVLARARQFLPLLASSNADLLKRHAENPDLVNIENTENDERVVAMDVGLGVFDVNGEVKGDMGPEVEVDEAKAKQAAKNGGNDDEDEDSSDEAEEDSSSQSDSSESDARTDPKSS